MEPQPLETGVAFKKTMYCCNCQRNYTLFYKDKLCQNKQAEIGKKLKLIKKFFRVGSLNKENNIKNHSYSFWKYAYKKVNWHIHIVLLQLSWGHNQSPNDVSNMQRTAQLLHGLYKYYGQELFSSLVVVPY